MYTTQQPMCLNVHLVSFILHNCKTDDVWRLVDYEWMEGGLSRLPGSAPPTRPKSPLMESVKGWLWTSVMSAGSPMNYEEADRRG